MSASPSPVPQLVATPRTAIILPQADRAPLSVASGGPRQTTGEERRRGPLAGAL